MTCVGSFDSVSSVRIVRDAGMVCVSRSLEIKHAAGKLETMATTEKEDSGQNKEYSKKRVPTFAPAGVSGVVW